MFVPLYFEAVLKFNNVKIFFVAVQDIVSEQDHIIKQQCWGAGVCGNDCTGKKTFKQSKLALSLESIFGIYIIPWHVPQSSSSWQEHALF